MNKKDDAKPKEPVKLDTEPKATKETTVKEADKKAESVKSADECKKMILDQAMKLESGEQHSVQQMFAYVRQLKKCK